DIAREELALGTALLAGTHLHHFFGRHHHIAETVFHAGAHDAIAQRLRDGLLETGIGVDHVPALHCDILLSDPGSGTVRSPTSRRNRSRPGSGSGSPPRQSRPRSCWWPPGGSARRPCATRSAIRPGTRAGSARAGWSGIPGRPPPRRQPPPVRAADRTSRQARPRARARKTRTRRTGRQAPAVRPART